MFAQVFRPELRLAHLESWLRLLFVAMLLVRTVAVKAAARGIYLETVVPVVAAAVAVTPGIGASRAILPPATFRLPLPQRHHQMNLPANAVALSGLARLRWNSCLWN